MKEPLDANAARKLIAKIRSTSGRVVLWDHCSDELANDKLDALDVDNVLRCGRITEPAEEKGDRWRYRVKTDRMCVVVQFESDSELSVVTAWRIKGR